MDGAQRRNAQKQTITPRLRAAPHATSFPPAMNFHRLPTSRRDACMYVRAVHKGATACRCVEPRTPSFRVRGTQPTGAALKKNTPKRKQTRKDAGTSPKRATQRRYARPVQGCGGATQTPAPVFSASRVNLPAAHLADSPPPPTAHFPSLSRTHRHAPSQTDSVASL